MLSSRPLTGLERVWLASDRAWPPFVVQVGVEGRGVLDPARWSRALHDVAAAWPGARARLAGASWWTRWVADGAPPTLRIVDTPWDGRGPATFTDAPLDPWRGPIVEVVLAGERAVVRAHHAAFDGAALWAFAEDLGRALRGEPVVGAAFAGLRDDRLAGPGPVASEPPADAVVPLAGGLPDAARLVDTDASTWVRRRYQAPSSHVLARLVVAFARATLWRDGPAAPDPQAFLRVSIPVDLRRHAPGPAAANLTGFVRLRVDTADTPASVDAALTAALARREELEAVRLAHRVRALPLAWLARVGRDAGRRALARGRGATSLTISNLGRQDPAALSHPGFQAERLYWIPPGGAGTPLFLMLTGHADAVELCVGAPRGLAADGRLDALVDHALAELGAPGAGT